MGQVGGHACQTDSESHTLKQHLRRMLKNKCLNVSWNKSAAITWSRQDRHLPGSTAAPHSNAPRSCCHRPTNLTPTTSCNSRLSQQKGHLGDSSPGTRWSCDPGTRRRSMLMSFVVTCCFIHVEKHE